MTTPKSAPNNRREAWIIFEIKSGLFVGFFFDRGLALTYLNRNPETWRMEHWSPSHLTI